MTTETSLLIVGLAAKLKNDIEFLQELERRNPHCVKTKLNIFRKINEFEDYRNIFQKFLMEDINEEFVQYSRLLDKTKEGWQDAHL